MVLLLLLLFVCRHIWKLDLTESTPTPQPVGPAMYGFASGIAAYSSEHYTQGEEYMIWWYCILTLLYLSFRCCREVSLGCNLHSTATC